jgi:hypothetical protein
MEVFKHKVCIYTEYHSVSPVVGIGTLSPASVPPPPKSRGRGGHTRLRVRGWGSPNSDDWRKSSALCLLCVFKFPFIRRWILSLILGIIIFYLLEIESQFVYKKTTFWSRKNYFIFNSICDEKIRICVRDGCTMCTMYIVHKTTALVSTFPSNANFMEKFNS